MSQLAEARRVFDVEIAALEAVRDNLDAAFATAADWIVECVNRRGKLVIVGVGKSGNVGAKIAATFTSTGSTGVVLNSVDALHGDLGVVNEGDVILVLSYSGESDEVINLLPALKRFSVKIIALTGAPESTLAKHADLVLKVTVPREACPFNLAPTSSTTAMLVMGDALAMTVLQARGFNEEQFARLHPSGSIGRSLLLRVSDIMRAEGRYATAGQGVTVRESLLLMTRARCGSVCVVDDAGAVAGVFTDGDLRRHLAEGDEVLLLPLERVMTRNPVVVRAGALAMEAVKIFDERNIDDLIVVNDQNQPVGLVDSQDLPRLKLM